MKNRLTAEQAHEIATNWQENKCAAYVDYVLDIIKERAGKATSLRMCSTLAPRM